jgi:hypothetical protein
MVLVGLIVTVFLLFEARRYRYFNVWRARARLLETVAKDYCDPRYHISSARAIGRRLRRTYAWIFIDPSSCILRQARDPPDDHRPVRSAVKARSPGSASVDFTSVEMGECANLRGTELGLLSRLTHRFARIA